MRILKLTFIALVTTLVVSCDQKKEETTVNENVAATDNVHGENPQESNMNSNAEKPSDVNPEDAAVFTLEQDTYDFGDVTAGSKADKVIEFTNTGKTPLVIQKASASCGCTVPEYSKEPVAPGEKGQITVSYSAPANNGLQTKTVTLNTNTANKVETFKIKANVVGGSEKQAPRPTTPMQLPTPNLGEVN